MLIYECHPIVRSRYAQLRPKLRTSICERPTKKKTDSKWGVWVQRNDFPKHGQIETTFEIWEGIVTCNHAWMALKLTRRLLTLLHNYNSFRIIMVIMDTSQVAIYSALLQLAYSFFTIITMDRLPWPLTWFSRPSTVKQGLNGQFLAGSGETLAHGGHLLNGNRNRLSLFWLAVCPRVD